MTRRIPVIILSGFLGSGKTTLLKRILHTCQKHHLRPGTLINELGTTDTDGNIIGEANSVQNIEKLFDGCMCCNKKGEVVKYLVKLLESNPDIIFIELTGVANPEEVADSLTEPEVKDNIYLNKVITVLDAEHILEYNSIFDATREVVLTTRRQIEVADLLLLNKTDLVTSDHINKIEKVLRKYNPDSPIQHTTFCSFQEEELISNLKNDYTEASAHNRVYSYPNNSREHTHLSEHAHSRINTLTLPVQFEISPKKLEKFLKTWRKQLIRAKGYIPVSGSNTTYLMQHVMKRTYWEPTTYLGDGYLVLIGIALNKDEIKSSWQQFQLENNNVKS